jgi:hypothetical protein
MSMLTLEDLVPDVRRDASAFDVIETWRTVLCATCQRRPVNADDPSGDGQCAECVENELYTLWMV